MDRREGLQTKRDTNFGELYVHYADVVMGSYTKTHVKNVPNYTL